MIRGATDTHYIDLPVEPSLVSKIVATYTQEGIEKIRRTEADMTLEGRRVSWRLKQEETLSLQGDAFVTVQINALCIDGTRLPTPEYKIYVLNNNYPEVMKNDE